MIFEITQDHQILVPLMVANMLSFLISKHYQPLPIYDALLLQDGVHLPHRVARPSTARRTARDLMSSRSARLPVAPSIHVHPDHAIDVVIDRFSEVDGDLPVVSRADATILEGVITADALAMMLRRPHADPDGLPADG